MALGSRPSGVLPFHGRGAEHLSPERAGRQPLLQEKTTHLPASQPTPTEPRIRVQSWPSPVEVQPPHESTASSYVVDPIMGQAISSTGQRVFGLMSFFFLLASTPLNDPINPRTATAIVQRMVERLWRRR